jgi:HK97 family phage prohead protease
MRIYEKKANSSLTYSVKDIDTTGRILSVYWSAFDNKDRDSDVILKGAFSKTIKEQGPQGLGEQWFIKFHNPDMPIATPFELAEDNYGLLARIKMPNVPAANDVLEMYKDGHYKHQSIGFQTIRQQKKADYNEISEIKLYEGSVVLWAANPSAKFVDVKGFMTPKEIADELALTIKGLRDGKYTDETFALLEIKMRQLIQASADIASSTPAAENAPEPQKDEVNVEAETKIKSLIELFS